MDKYYSGVQVSYLNEEDMYKKNVVYKIVFPDGSVYIGGTKMLLSKSMSSKSSEYLVKKVLTPTNSKIKEFKSFSVIILEYCLNNEEVLEKVEEYISMYGMENLLNATTGGSNPKPDFMSRKKMSLSHTGNKLSKSCKDKISKNHHMRGKFGKEHRNSLPVKQICKDSGEVIKIWDSIVEASIGLGVRHKSSISKCCKGKQMTCYGFKWEYCNSDYSV